MSPGFLSPALVTLALFVACFFATLAVAVYIVAKTGTTTGLRDLAELVRAFFRSKV
ncbi:MAG: hypothetical protein LC775_07510 [Acidobacteria bacterium]|nr:hypothetical protein [Acidobacteriota bacterium]